ncbi:FMR1-interacting protein NUFIP1 [Stomoxys calcitrans]|uniref:FMR1-interacting protein NUFIP1 n=1 Tax=Stomoxys calcitrans TaxID=35570 RepID=UPI0027E29B05|nr:FMR1-interacting protein NUFIP1 [Stomoxys calcitrans]
MEKPFKFLLPSPNFGAKTKESVKPKPHFLTPSGMTLLPRDKQPPPMYGKRGATIPPRYLKPVAPPPTMTQPLKQYCEPCEMELGSLEDFKQHRAQHEKCPVDGCQYRGHPTVMDKHVSALHASGLFDKFKKLSTPEEIAAWREERRKKYPTVANVLLKQKAQEQRQKRGERLEANKSRFGKQDDRKRALPNKESKDGSETTHDRSQPKNKNKNKKKRKNNREKNHEKQKPVGPDEKEQKSCGEEEEIRGPMFPGTLGMEGYEHFHKSPPNIPGNALLGLIGAYGSDDNTDTEDEGSHNIAEKSILEKDVNLKSTTIIDSSNAEMENSKIKEGSLDCLETKIEDKLREKSPHEAGPDERTHTQEHSEQPIVAEAIKQTLGEDTNLHQLLLTESSKPNKENSSDEGPEETAIMRTMPEYKTEKQNSTPPTPSPAKPKDATTEKNETNKKAKQAVKRKFGLDYRKAKVRKQNTMLEKLLETDIRHERNVLLQCVRYVCENNFFGVSQTQTPPNP